MSTIVYQNHASSCFESQITETTTTTTLKLKLAPHAPTTFNDLFFHPKQSSIDQKQSFYTHPFVNKSSSPSFSRLSAKSLELCTECLGSETGNDIENSSSTQLSFDIEESNERTESLNKPVHGVEKNSSCRKVKNFPPPLTSSLQVRSRREDGRLVIEAVEKPSMDTYLQAERCDGRLKLCFSTNIVYEEEEEEEEDEDEDEEMNMEIEMEMEKFGRNMSGCFNGNEELCSNSSSNWKSALWVATS